MRQTLVIFSALLLLSTVLVVERHRATGDAGGGRALAAMRRQAAAHERPELGQGSAGEPVHLLRAAAPEEFSCTSPRASRPRRRVNFTSGPYRTKPLDGLDAAHCNIERVPCLDAASFSARFDGARPDRGSIFNESFGAC